MVLDRSEGGPQCQNGKIPLNYYYPILWIPQQCLKLKPFGSEVECFHKKKKKEVHMPSTEARKSLFLYVFFLYSFFVTINWWEWQLRIKKLVLDEEVISPALHSDSHFAVVFVWSVLCWNAHRSAILATQVQQHFTLSAQPWVQSRV